MKIQSKISIIILLISLSCKQSGTISQKKNSDKVNEDPEIYNDGIFNESQQDINSNQKTNVTSQNDENTIVKEHRELLESTKRIIQRNQQIPTFSLYDDSGRFELIKNHYLQSICEHINYKNHVEFNTGFNETFINSSEQTGKYDGQLFCISKFNESETETSKIIYKRSEGGHTSDKIQLITSNNQLKQIYVLPLSYQTGWDGHEITVKSNINNNVITRKIIERYGWSNMHPDSLNKQPKRVVIQQIVVRENGKLEVLKEEIRKYNIDELFD
jgi:hypothetical protein